MKQSSVRMINAATGLVTSESHEPRAARRTFQATGQTSSGAGSATVEIQVSNDNQNFILLATITLVLGVTTTTDGLASDAAWRYARAKVTAISGTGAEVSVWMGA